MNVAATFSGGKGGFDTLPAVTSLSVGSYVGEHEMPFHYTYRLIAQNPIDDRVEYIGVRSCECDPANDTAYMSSSREVKALIKSGMVFVKEIIATWPSRKAAVAHEIALHAEFDVARSPRFFNKAKQTTVGWDTGGTSNPIHAEFVKSLWQNDSFRQKSIAAIRKSRSNPKYRKLRSKIAKEIRNRPGHFEKMSKAMKIALNKPEITAKMSLSAAKSWADPEFREKMVASRRITHTTDAFKKKQSESTKKQMANPDAKKALSSVVTQMAALKNQYCKVLGIINPGKGYSNIDKADFARWLAENKKEAA